MATLSGHNEYELVQESAQRAGFVHDPAQGLALGINILSTPSW